MRSFFKVFFASFLSLVVFAILAVMILFGFIGMAMSADKPEVGSNAVLVLDLDREIHEQEVENPLAEFTGDNDDNVPGLYELVRMLNAAKADENIKGIYIKGSINPNGFATSDELRNAILDFRKSGKFVIAYGEVLSQKAYYIASAADKVYCNPKGTLDWRGLESTLVFLKGTLEKLEIQPQIFYAGKFKSATEPLREYQMTEANKIQTTVYLNDLYASVLLAAAAHSGSDTASLHQLANSGSIQTAYDALRYRLIDGVRYDDQVKSEIISRLRIDKDSKINFISPGKYAKTVNLPAGKAERIAVVYAEGEIIDGRGQSGSIASDEFRAIIRKVRLDKNVKAVVFRVNSPGGSALASEVILREISETRKLKPVVVSFGDVAASGGYYIAAQADSIFANPTTITGSIGVFGIIPNMQAFFKNKLGMTFDGVKTGPFADMLTISRPLTEPEKRFVQNSIDTIYLSFKQRVSEGRKKPIEYVDSIAQGRVWTGTRGLQIGLVDKLGSIQDAVNCAARMAKLKDYSLKAYPEKKGFLESILGEKKNEMKAQMIREDIGDEQYELLKHLQRVKRMVAIPQTRLPYDLNIQ
ncbi:signal peptide peptidase SppA [Segetibacter sp. 3557_3]|uniref:signal peptide peptidase SppA n=1 Tax=Segetibacter sp. 3557_3 TaxID=2547429 RepID=UPI0010586D2A|nr:signal peptide peptidase SppA [Segetibacter sp. 3557_3]TDH26535.1 signal peptide peptidase SppA [Segetibacter sp. 3557_3]